MDRDLDLCGIGEAGCLKRKISNCLLLEIEISPIKGRSILKSHPSVGPKKGHGFPLIVGHIKYGFEFNNRKGLASHANAGGSLNSLGRVSLIHALAAAHIEEVAQDFNLKRAARFGVTLL